MRLLSWKSNFHYLFFPNRTKLVCAVGSRNGTEETKLLVLDFEVPPGQGYGGSRGIEYLVSVFHTLFGCFSDCMLSVWQMGWFFKCFSRDHLGFATYWCGPCLT